MLIPDYPLTTARLQLRPFQDEDLQDMYAFNSLPEIARFLYWEARTLEETRAALERKKGEVTLKKEGDNLCLAVVLPETGTVIGDVALFWRSEEHKQGEVGYMLHPQYAGRGYATEAARRLLALGFDTLELHRIYSRCDARNVASYRVMERLGMRREAHLKHNEFFKGEWGDELVYALLREEWDAQRE